MTFNYENCFVYEHSMAVASAFGAQFFHNAILDGESDFDAIILMKLKFWQFWQYRPTRKADGVQRYGWRRPWERTQGMRWWLQGYFVKALEETNK